MRPRRWCLAPEQMAAVDRAAIAAGLSGLVMMESAGRGVAEAVVERFPAPGSVRVLVGKGNNGGDGLVVARTLVELGWDAELLMCAEPETFEGDAAIQWRLVEPLEIEIRQIGDEAEARAAIGDGTPTCVIDALLGTGLRGDVREPARTLISALNETRVPVFAVDAPSGLDGRTGEVRGVAVCAERTVTFGFPKPGLFLDRGPHHAGRVTLVRLGYPPAALSAAAEHPLEVTGLEAAMVSLPPVDRSAHKGSRGRVLLVAGSDRYKGAAVLAAVASLRGGAGMTVVAAPASIVEFVVAQVPEALVEPLPERKAGGPTAAAARRVADLATEADVVAIGPGLTTGTGVRELVSTVLDSRKTLVVDADALNAIAADPSVVERESTTVITPHPGELGRWMNRSAGEIDRDRVEAAHAAARTWNVHVILKGAPTIVADPNGSSALNLTGNPALAAGGSGDVLTGLLAALLAQGTDARVASRAAPFLHGLAADWGAFDLGPRGFAPSDLFRYLPLVFREIAAGSGGDLLSRIDHPYAALVSG